jgi:RecA/RadA recombinase
MASIKKAVKEAPTKAARVKKAAKEPATPKFDYASIYNESIDVIARRQGAEASNLDIGEPMSTGLLCYDLMLGGGIRPGMYTSAGGEQSAKTTTALIVMANAVKQGIPLLEYWDFEGSTKNSKAYVRSILKGSGVKLTIDELFGKKDAEGRYTLRPRVRYHSESVGEKFFDYMSEVLRNLPDKKFINKKWWLVFEDNKVNKAKYGEAADASMPKKYGKGLWIEAPDGKLQAIFFVDSYPAMNSIANDEEDVNNGLALQARMFSKHLPRVKGRLADKMVAFIGINQMRAVPMAMFGPKEQEPGGQALRFNSDVRTRNTPRGSGQPLWPKNFSKETYMEEEKSVEFEGVDKYRYIHKKAIKNKLWTPQRTGWFRIWVEDGSGTARGFDPFFDTIFYLKQTGQVVGKGRDKLLLTLDGIGKAKPLTWYDYKKWVLGDKEAMTTICKKAGFKPMSLRAYCFKQVADGTGEKLYLAQKDTTTDESED